MNPKRNFLSKLWGSSKTLYLSSAGSLGLLSAAGACGVGCGAGVFSASAFFSAMGLGTLALWLPPFRVPLLVIAAILGLLVVRNVNRRGHPALSSVVGCLIGSFIVLFGFLAFRSSSCGIKGASTYSKLSSQTKRIVVNGIYTLWPQLGRAPTIAEIQQAVGLASEKPIHAAFQELKEAGYGDAFYAGTDRLRWLWPLSTVDLGITVTLQGEKPVYARCAVDALGTSEMFGKPAVIEARSPIDHKILRFVVEGDKIQSASPGVVISTGATCDDLLFFSSLAEFEEYKKEMNKGDLRILTLQQALDRGVRAFGTLLRG